MLAVMTGSVFLSWVLLWRNFGDPTDVLVVMVPVIVIASGQLSGLLALMAGLGVVVAARSATMI